MRINRLQEYLNLEAASGCILFICALAALIWSNSPLYELHERLVQSTIFIVNEGLMTFFFLVVGLELKRSFMDGNFSNISQIALPGIAAIGGMVIPAAIYFLFNFGDSIALQGWATPVATDIAFALGVLSLFGKKIPVQLKLFLLSLAIFDDVGAILIIAIFYTYNISIFWLMVIALFIFVLYLINRHGVRMPSPYLFLALCLWFALYKAHIHPTITGVLLALFIPDNKSKAHSTLRKLEHTLHPWVAFLIMPLFALINAGIRFSDLPDNLFSSTVVLGVSVGLLVGKQIGVFGFSFAMIKARWAELPQNTTWLGLYGVALLCGIGFTMSLFLGTLSFANQDIYLSEVKVGVISGSLVSGVLGAIILGIFSIKTLSRRG